MNTKLRHTLLLGAVVVVTTGAVLAFKHFSNQRASQESIARRVALSVNDVKNITQLRQVVTTQQNMRDGYSLSADEVDGLISIVKGPPDAILQAKALATLSDARNYKLLSPAQESSVVDASITALQGPEHLVRLLSCGLLGRWGVKSAVPRILPLLNDSDPMVQKQARRELTRLGYKF